MGLRASILAGRAWAGNPTYLVTTGVGSAIGLVRGFAVAALLPIEDFGLYGVVVAVAAFLSPIVGLGRIEETRKLFPRLAVEGRHEDIRREVRRLLMRLLWRIAVLCLLVGSVAWAAFGPFWALMTVCTCGLVTGMSGCMVLASALRAGSDLRPLGRSALLRGMVTFMLAVACAWQFGLAGALVGEAAGAVAAALIMQAMLAFQRHSPSDLAGSAAAVETDSRDSAVQGRMLLLAGLLVSIPLYLSRPLGGLIYSPQLLGTFGFVALFFTAVSALYAITDQIIGPDLVRMQHAGRKLGEQRRRLAQFAAAIAALTLAGLALVFLLLSISPLRPYSIKFGFDLALMLPTALFCGLQATGTFDWMLQAHDRERAILAASAAHAALFLAGFAIVAHFQLPLEAALWVLVLSKTVQLAMQLREIGALGEGQPHASG